MMLIDTSVIIQLLRDETGKAAKNWRKLVARDEFVLSRLTQAELLQGARDEDHWQQLDGYLEGQDYVEAYGPNWRDAARIYFDLRRKGSTVRGVIDCCIAQLAIEHKLTLVHRDKDYETIARIRPLRHRRIDLSRM